MEKGGCASLFWTLPMLFAMLAVTFAVLGFAAGIGIGAFNWAIQCFGVEVELSFDFGIFTAFLTALAALAVWKIKLDKGSG
ncbi:hypothetical protein K8I61_02715 [bacterium]|nr:hypothetical protein [bacterium]